MRQSNRGYHPLRLQGSGFGQRLIQARHRKRKATGLKVIQRHNWHGLRGGGIRVVDLISDNDFLHCLGHVTYRVCTRKRARQRGGDQDLKNCFLTVKAG